MTALFVTNYEMTMGVVIGSNELGIRIPDGLSIVGFDNLEFAKACSPSLTIISQPTREIGEKVAEIMLMRLSQKNEAREESLVERLETTMIEGRSVAEL